MLSPHPPLSIKVLLSLTHTCLEVKEGMCGIREGLIESIWGLCSQRDYENRIDPVFMRARKSQKGQDGLTVCMCVSPKHAESTLFDEAGGRFYSFSFKLLIFSKPINIMNFHCFD